MRIRFKRPGVDSIIRHMKAVADSQNMEEKEQLRIAIEELERFRDEQRSNWFVILLTIIFFVALVRIFGEADSGLSIELGNQTEIENSTAIPISNSESTVPIQNKKAESTLAELW